jgi:hypothetical protein
VLLPEQRLIALDDLLGVAELPVTGICRLQLSDPPAIPIKLAATRDKDMLEAASISMGLIQQTVH